MTSKLPTYTLLTGLIVLVGFVVLCVYMIDASMALGKDEQFRWDHLLVVFNSIQTMAAAALGVLLGTTVQQARVDSARARADVAEAKADQNAKGATKTEAVRGLLTGVRAQAAGSDPAATLKAIEAMLDA
jgi:hypothetical protein